MMYPRVVMQNGLLGLIPVSLSWILLIISLVMSVRKKQDAASCFFAASWFCVSLALLAALSNLSMGMQGPNPDVGIVALFATSFLMITNYACLASLPVLAVFIAFSVKDRTRMITRIICLLAFVALMVISGSIGKVVADWGLMQIGQEQIISNK